VIWGFGLLIVSRVRMLHVTLTYVACFVALAVLRHWIVGGPLLAEIAPVTGPMYQLFIFFMITDPKTTVSTVRGRISVAAAVAVAEAGIRLAGDFHVPALNALYPRRRSSASRSSARREPDRPLPRSPQRAQHLKLVVVTGHNDQAATSRLPHQSDVAHLSVDQETAPLHIHRAKAAVPVPESSRP